MKKSVRIRMVEREIASCEIGIAQANSMLNFDADVELQRVREEMIMIVEEARETQNFQELYYNLESLIKEEENIMSKKAVIPHKAHLEQRMQSLHEDLKSLRTEHEKLKGSKDEKE